MIECIQSSGWTGYMLMKVRQDFLSNVQKCSSVVHNHCRRYTYQVEASCQAEAKTRISSLEDDIFQISAQLSPKMVTFLMNPHRLMLLFAVFMLSYIALRYHQDPCYNFLNKTLLHKLSEEDSFK